MMTLKEAIKHCKDVALSCTNKECALEHFQLLKWLQEYSNMLEKQGEPNLIMAKSPQLGGQKSFARYKVGDTIYYNSFGRLVSFVISNIVEDGTDNPMYQDNDGNCVFQNDIVELEHKSVYKRVQPQPKQEWSEEDEARLKSVISLMKSNHAVDPFYDKMYLENWLKSLKDRYTWKPSEKQIKACKEVYADLLSARGFDIGVVNNELNRLEEQLKKLF